MLTRKMKASVLLLFLSVQLDGTRITLAEEESSAQSSLLQIQQQQQQSPQQQGLRGTRRAHCPSTEERVCCLDGVEYPNLCTAIHIFDLDSGDCARTHFYNPVCCGIDNDRAEYFNACQATAAGRQDCSAGPCPLPCAAAANDPPVCCHGTDNYHNLCQAELVLDAAVAATACAPGLCPPPTPLPCSDADGTMPVANKVCCDAGRREFLSPCHAAQGGFDSTDCVVGACPTQPEPLNCPAVYQPVCCHVQYKGTMTVQGFPSPCEAAKGEVILAACFMGECPPSSSSSPPPPPPTELP